MRSVVIGNYMNANFLRVPRLPQPGESLAATGVFQEHGGKGLNLAVGLHLLGAETGLLMAVGHDTAGDAVIHHLQSLGLDTSHVVRVPAASGYGVGFIAPDGSNFLAAYQGANALLSATHVAEATTDINAADWVVAQFEAPEAAIHAAFRLARSQGARTYLNPSPWHEPVAELLQLTDVLVVNATEAAAFFDRPEIAQLSVADWTALLPDLAQKRGWRGHYLVVTLAEQGALALDREGGIAWAPAFIIDQVDATGAGDAFGCGLVWAFGHGPDLQQALRIANACGAIIAASEGILARLPTTAVLQQFMESHRQR
jgi:ribokinase